MTGSLQVKNGKYYTVIYANDNDGKPIHKWEKTGLAVKGNKRIAEKILRERIIEFEQKSVAVTKDVLFADFMVEWLEVVRTQIKASTYHQYQLIVNNSIVPYFRANKVRLRDLQPHHIQKYYNHKIKEGVSGNTVKHHHANIHKALNYALKSNWIAYNPSDRVELPKLEKFSCSFYTDAQIKKLLDLAKSTNIETPVLLTATYGLRRSEVIGLKWNAIDFVGNTITIQHTVVGNGKKYVFC